MPRSCRAPVAVSILTPTKFPLTPALSPSAGEREISDWH